MEENDKPEQEKLKELVNLHHKAIVQLIRLLKNKEKKEADLWNSLLKNVKEVQQENGKS
jgi:DNA anti-recombination protein RmuC